jgi:hypothetical protein
LIHPLGLGTAAILAACAVALRYPALPWPTTSPGWRWAPVLATGMLPWWPLALLALAAGCRRGDYAASFWRLAACWALAPMVLAAAGLLDGRAALAADCGAVSLFSAAGLWELVRWWRSTARKREATTDPAFGGHSERSGESGSSGHSERSEESPCDFRQDPSLRSG